MASKSLSIEANSLARSQLQVIIDWMLGWTFDLASEQVLSAEGQEVSTREWNGPSEYEGGMVYNAVSQRWDANEDEYEDLWESEFQDGTIWGALEGGGEDEDEDGLEDVAEEHDHQEGQGYISSEDEDNHAAHDSGPVEGDDGVRVDSGNGRLSSELSPPADSPDKLDKVSGEGDPFAAMFQAETVATDPGVSSETEQSPPPLIYCIKTLRWTARAKI